MQRAVRTCELAGFGAVAEVDPNLVEWNYGDYEGLRTAQIQAKRPGWQLFRDGCPGGESPDQIGERADRTVSRLRECKGNVLDLFERAFPAGARRPLAWTGTRRRKIPYVKNRGLSALGYENNLSRPVIDFWDDTGCAGD